MTASAADRVARAEPVWTGVARVADVIESSGERVLLHAGPTFASPRIVPEPVIRSLETCCLLEGWATDREEARDLVLGGGVTIAPAQEHGVLVPLAGVASPGMAVAVVHDETYGSTRSAVLNEGQAHATRLGVRDDATIEHHRWLDGVLADWLNEAVADPIPLWPVLARSLELGDDGHSRTHEGSRLLALQLAQRRTVPPGVAAFLDASPAFALNLWMAAVAAALASAEGVGDGAIVTRAGGNGVAFGICVAGSAPRWTTVPATPPQGEADARHAGRRPLGAIGDSAVVDLFGLGGMTLPEAPTVLLAAAADGLSGQRVAISAHAVVEQQRSPVIVLGMIDAAGEAGRIGGGRYEPPVDLFRAAVAAAASTAST
jgi:hypothetical protein